MNPPVIDEDLVLAHRHGIKVICQQNNCITRSAKGLALHIASQLGVNPYLHRIGCSSPGVINIIQSPIHPLIVVNMYAQYYPGKPSSKLTPGLLPDSAEQRLIWFRKCCQELHKWLVQVNISQVGVPYGIGCGLAGGSWPAYLKILEEELPERVLFRYSGP